MPHHAAHAFTVCAVLLDYFPIHAARLSARILVQ
jgi:hypothetical protein